MTTIQYILELPVKLQLEHNLKKMLLRRIELNF